MTLFGHILRQERKEKGLSQKELGQRLGVSQAMIAQYENGKRTPKVGTITKIANALEIPASELLECYDILSKSDSLRKIDGTNTINSDKPYTIADVLKDLDIDLNEFNTTFGFSEKNIENYLLNKFRILNNDGKVKAIEQVELLTKIEEYRKKDQGSNKA